MDLKKKINDNEFTIGSWITIANTAITEIMASEEFDWLAIDMEHSAITLSEAQNLMQVISSKSIVPIVRVGDNDSTIIKRIMDAGAQGVIVPMVNSKEDAIKAVESVYYPPRGKRGVGLARAQGYGLGFENYKEWLSKEAIVVVQIEHIDAINNLEEILAVDGVDASMIGPYDLSGSLGYPGEFDRKEVKEALAQYLKVCNKLNKCPGFHSVPASIEQFNLKKDEGYKFLGFSLDSLFLAANLRDCFSNM